MKKNDFDEKFESAAPGLAAAARVTAESTENEFGPDPTEDTRERPDEIDDAAKAATTDAVLVRAFERQIMPPSLDAIEKRSWSSDEDVPEYVIDALQQVVDRGAVFDDFKSVPGRVADVIEDALADALTEPNGWSLDSIVDRMSDALPRADPADLETIARTESAKVLNEAREEGYRDRGLDDAKFKWVGPSDSRTTDACEELKDRTNPDHGGTPVSLPELTDEERDVHADHFPNLEYRKHTLHPNERHTFVRVPESGVDDFDVDVPDADEISVDTAAIEPQELSIDGNANDHSDAYADTVDRVVKQTNTTRRMREVESALGTPMPTALRECLESSDGTKRGALRELNGRLRAADDYDHDANGVVSPNTLYAWLSAYDTHVDHLT